MCIMCVEILKERMTAQEVIHAYKEMKIPEEHEGELMDLVNETYGSDVILDLLIDEVFKSWTER